MRFLRFGSGRRIEMGIRSNTSPIYRRLKIVSKTAIKTKNYSCFFAVSPDLKQKSTKVTHDLKQKSTKVTHDLKHFFNFIVPI